MFLCPLIVDDLRMSVETSTEIRENAASAVKLWFTRKNFFCAISQSTLPRTSPVKESALWRYCDKTHTDSVKNQFILLPSSPTMKFKPTSLRVSLQRFEEPNASQFCGSRFQQSQNLTTTNAGSGGWNNIPMTYSSFLSPNMCHQKGIHRCK